MIIGLDAKRAMHNTTGLGNYSRYAVEALAGAQPQWQWRLYTTHGPVLERGNALQRLPGVQVVHGGGALWRSWGITGQLRRDGVHLYHGLSNELPLNIGDDIPSVVTVHDVIWRRVPRDYSPIDRRLYDLKYGRSMRRATRVIAISECTKRDIISDFGIAADKIDVVYQGVDPQFGAPLTDDKMQQVRSRYSLPQGPFIVTVGTVQSRKNQLQAVQALRGLPDEVSLVIAGRSSRGYGREIDEFVVRHGLGGRVVRLDNVAFADLPALYRMAVFASYTSRYEGFGLPVVEAVTAGVPVIAATGSCLEEAGGPGALYVSPDSVDEYVDAATRLLDDNALRRNLVARGAEHVARFSVKAFVEATLKTYKKALDR